VGERGKIKGKKGGCGFVVRRVVALSIWIARPHDQIEKRRVRGEPKKKK